MPTTVVCPDCRRPQVPREEAGRLICPDCDAILPSGLYGAGPKAEPADPRSSTSALDHPAAGQPRPSGSITLLRSGLRSDEKNQQGGWMEGLFSRKAKAPAEKALVPAGRGDREPAEESTVPRPASRPSSRDSSLLDEPGRPAPVPADRTDVLRRPPRRALAAPEGAREGRVPIAGILASLLVLAVASVALLQGGAPWANVLFLVTTFLLGVSLLGIVHRREGRRAFWQGFALFGWGYLAMALAPWGVHPAGLELPTTPLLGTLHAKAAAWSEGPREPSPATAAEPADVAKRPDTAAAAPDRPTPQVASMFVAGDLNQFLLVGHCLVALLAALLGSGIARWLHRSSLQPARQA